MRDVARLPGAAPLERPCCRQGGRDSEVGDGAHSDAISELLKMTESMEAPKSDAHQLRKRMQRKRAQLASSAGSDSDENSEGIALDHGQLLAAAGALVRKVTPTVLLAGRPNG